MVLQSDEIEKTVKKMKTIPTRYELKISNLKELEEIATRCGFYELVVKAYAFGFEKGHRATKNGKY